MKTKLITAPTVEPVSLAEMELHLRIESNDIGTDLTSTQSLAPASRAAGNHAGTGVDVLNSQTVVYVVSGTNEATGTLDVHIEESDDDVTYTDWDGGTFDQITTANDNATYEKEYTGNKQYIRAYATVANAACVFGVDVVTSSPYSVEDTYIEDLIKSARRLIELHTGRRFITQTWETALGSFPRGDKIELPYPPLQSVTSVKYYDTDDTEATFSSDDYYVDTYAEPGALSLNYGESWPSTTLRPANGVIVRYVVGYGDAESDVPEMYKQAIKILAAELYERREATDFKHFYELPWSVQQLLGYERMYRI
jgi:uncharacterized phiE125 gp8 family phage protein